MNRKKAEGLLGEVPTLIRNGNIFLLATEVNSLFDEIYNSYEQDLAIVSSNKTCDGCINKPLPKENYPEVCGTCRRWYSDNYEEKKDA